MENRETEMCREKGFTIVELLTVMSVIAILIALLVPALGMVRDYSKEVEQKAQLHGIDVGLELYKTEFGSYPESNDNSLDASAVDGTVYCGANKLAEAMVGLDMLGFHRNSDFRSDGTFTHVDGAGAVVDTAPTYHASNDYDGAGNLSYEEDATENIQARESHFVELESANAFTMEDVYGIGNAGSFSTADDPATNDYPTLVLCDVYAKKREKGVKTGAPVLYYRARTVYTAQDSGDTNGIDDDIYYYPDNEELLALGSADDNTIDHPLADGTTDEEDFETMIINKQVTAIKRPYRADSYILVTAGKDGVYGTADDIFNFKKTE